MFNRMAEHCLQHVRIKTRVYKQGVIPKPDDAADAVRAAAAACGLLPLSCLRDLDCVLREGRTGWILVWRLRTEGKKAAGQFAPVLGL